MDTVLELYRAAKIELDKDEFAEAAAKLTKACAADSSSPMVWNALGYSLMRLQHYPDAMTALNKAIALKPDYENAFHNRSVLKRLMGDEKGAKQDSDEAVRLHGVKRK